MSQRAAWGMTTMLEVRVFDTLSVRVERGNDIRIGAPDARELLAYLAVAEGRVTANRVIEDLWQLGPETGLERLRVAAQDLRAPLAEVTPLCSDLLLAPHGGLQLHPRLIRTDIGHFRSTLRLIEDALGYGDETAALLALRSCQFAAGESVLPREPARPWLQTARRAYELDLAHLRALSLTLAPGPAARERAPRRGLRAAFAR